MFRDFKELLSVLNAHRVKYLVVGGYAVSLHAEPRATKDLDVLIGRSAENSKALFAALAEFGAPLEGLTHKDFMEPGAFFRMGTPPVMVDILSSIRGVDFDQAWQRRVEFPVDSGLNAAFISRDDLLAAKLAAGRPQDLADAAALDEHLDVSQRGAHDTQADLPGTDMEATRKRAVGDWLKHRARRTAEHGSQTIEQKRAKAVEDWKKLRKQRAQPKDAGKEGTAQDASRKESAKGSGKDAADDSDP